MHEYTKFCVSKLRESLCSECPYLDWTDEETIEGTDFTTRIDISGKDKQRIVLIQFEMHREAVSTNALKAAYCLENDPRFRGRQILMLHVLSPFHEKPEQDPYDPGEEDVPEWADTKDYRGFRKKQKKRETRASGRRSAHIHKLLVLFLKRKGVLDNATTSYKVIEWPLDIPEVREATRVLPDEGSFPERTQEAIADLARLLRKAIEEWR